MLFDLKRYLEIGKVPYESRFAAELIGRDFSGARIPQPVEALFTAARVMDGVALTLQAEAEVQSECARCLDPVSMHAAVHAEWTVREQDLEDPDFELPLDEKGKLDVGEWLYQEFLFQIPAVLLCSADCQGLCPECGQKKADCTCCKTAEQQAAPLDARLSILKSLLN